MGFDCPSRLACAKGQTRQTQPFFFGRNLEYLLPSLLWTNNL
jgi:hypothetical protein